MFYFIFAYDMRHIITWADMSKRTSCVRLLNIKLNPLSDTLFEFVLFSTHLSSSLRRSRRRNHQNMRRALHIYEWICVSFSIFLVFFFSRPFKTSFKSQNSEDKKRNFISHWNIIPSHPISPHKKEIIINLDIYLHALLSDPNGSFFVVLPSFLQSVLKASRKRNLQVNPTKKSLINLRLNEPYVL